MNQMDEGWGADLPKRGRVGGRRVLAALLIQALYTASNVVTSIGVAWKFGIGAAGDSALVVGTAVTAIAVARALFLEPLSATGSDRRGGAPEAVFMVAGLMAGLVAFAPLAGLGAATGLNLVIVGAAVGPGVSYAEGVRYGLLQAGRLSWVALIDGFWFVSTLIALFIVDSWALVVGVWVAAPVAAVAVVQVVAVRSYSAVAARLRESRSIARWTAVEGLSFAAQEQVYRLALGTVGSSQLGAFRIAQVLAAPTSLAAGGMHIFDLGTRDQTCSPRCRYLAIFALVASLAASCSLVTALLVSRSAILDQPVQFWAVVGLALSGFSFAVAVPLRNFARATGAANVGALAQLTSLALLVLIWRVLRPSTPAAFAVSAAVFGSVYLVAVAAAVTEKGRDG